MKLSNNSSSTNSSSKTFLSLNLLKVAVASALSLTLLGCNSPESRSDTTEQTTTSASDAHQNMNHSNSDSAMAHNNMNPTEPAEALGQDYSIYQVGGDWIDQNSKALTLDQLKGKNQVVVMAYTSCQHTCPILVRSMKQIHDEMTPSARAQTEFVLATLDTERDTPAVMANYAQYNDLGDNWHLIRSDEASTRMLANTLNIKYQFADNGDINHSNLISILDKEGRLVAQGVGIADSGIKPLIEYLNTHSE
ncbi:SCO family protein [Psychrobacter jeotgali]|uniref:SCO family protein n=1 Tax=Psychrobacter jeotgali TaxID=179010 RepID=UPI00191AC841|nr:SCO family protein [Psychrobacter jeotgali]